LTVGAQRLLEEALGGADLAEVFERAGLAAPVASAAA
jgi:hypothetical protein